MPESLRYIETISVWPTPSVLRGCQVCDHGKATEGRSCTHPEAGGKPSDTQRRRGGACGPEAKFLTIKGVEL